MLEKSSVAMLLGALARRAAYGLPDGETNALRVVHGEADGLPGVAVDSFDGHWLVQTRDQPWPKWLEGTKAEAGWRSLSWKRLDQHDKQSPVPMAGDVPDGVFRVRELGLEYEIDFGAGYSQGLFIDQRVQKARLLERMEPGQRFLNLFSYTCAFSVLAASRGAVTTSVDLSRPFLEWGKRNFGLNGLDEGAHFFCRGDAGEWLPRFAAKGRNWHGIVLDPPTFSRNADGGVWRVERDLPGMVAACLQVLEPGGWLMVSTNHHALTPGQFRSLVTRGSAVAGRPVMTWEAGSLPPDFPGVPYLKVATLTA
jgi:23S rRNA (cytosine1962-C5)-methyltransferase